MKTKINPRFIVLLLVMVATTATRFITEIGHTPLVNFTPIGAMAIFGGAYFSNRWKAVLLPLLTLLVSDLLINSVLFAGHYGIMYKGWAWVYGSFILMVFIGNYVIKQVNVKNILLATVAVSLLHWVITDFGVWYSGCLDITTGLPYTFDMQGLLKCYTLALPYLKNFFLGTACYSAIMFGIFELAKAKYSVLAVE